MLTYERIRAAVQLVNEAQGALRAFNMGRGLPERLAVLHGVLEEESTVMLLAMTPPEWNRTRTKLLCEDDGIWH